MTTRLGDTTWFQTPSPKWVPPELAARIDALAPLPPMWVDLRDDAQIERWEICARTAAAVGIHQQQADAEIEDRHVREFAWIAARELYRSDVRTGSAEDTGVA